MSRLLLLLGPSVCWLARGGGGSFNPSAAMHLSELGNVTGNFNCLIWYVPRAAAAATAAAGAVPFYF